MSTFQLYLILTAAKLESIVGSLGLILLGLFFLGYVIFRLILTDLTENDKDFYNKTKDMLATSTMLMKYSSIAVFLSCIFPSTKTAVMLIVWHIGGDIDGLTELPEDLVSYIRSFIDSELEN